MRPRCTLQNRIGAMTTENSNVHAVGSVWLRGPPVTMKQGASTGIGLSELLATTAFWLEARGKDFRSKTRLSPLASYFIPFAWLLCNFATHRHD